MRRYDLAQADWHVTLRGARRLFLFHELDDYQAFYSMLGYATERSGIRQIASCLMSNHFHLCLAGSSRGLSTCMWALDRAYSSYHNAKYDLSGHAFEAEYFREPIPSDFLLQRVIRYIHLNPVRGGLSQKPESYRWSSYPRLLRSPVELLGDDERRFLATFNADPAEARAAYAAFVEKDLARPIVRKAAKSSAAEVWEEQFRWFLDFAVESEKILFPLVPEVVAAWWAVQSGVPPRTVGEVLGHANGRRVSSLCYELSKRLKRTPSLDARVRSLGAL